MDAIVRPIVLLVAVAAAAAAFVYWNLTPRFPPRDGHALDGIVVSPVAGYLIVRDVALWGGREAGLQLHRSVVVRDGRIDAIVGDTLACLPGATIIEGSGKTLIPGLIDTHVHLMYDSGADLLIRAPKVMNEWRARIRRYPESREPIVRRGQLKLKAGVTTMCILGDGYYSLAYRDDLSGQIGCRGASRPDRRSPRERS